MVVAGVVRHRLTFSPAASSDYRQHKACCRVTGLRPAIPNGDTMTSNEAQIRAFLERRTDAQRSRDIDLLMSFYSPDIVYYDAVAPLRFTGADEVRRNFLRWFDGYVGPIGLETHDLTIVTTEDTAFANMLHLDSGKRRGGIELPIWVRETVCLRRLNGTWAITHEHISIPINPANFQIWFASEKDAPARGGGRSIFGLVTSSVRTRLSLRRGAFGKPA
ncbi:YybH family protein [Nocardia suismassiliense]|uniref:YybH family protein n=1 Tax=Nocardia suismassiliense TaxID=2077092 RepID=UPI001F1C0F1A|nr:nuclear transport factor 2 family protein [Nocardia suismassiliense]